jgi:hypothetical protein
MNNNPQISNSNLNISTSTSRETLQNSHNVTNLRAELTSNSKNGVFASKNINYKEKIFQVPMLPGENSFKNNSKEAKVIFPWLYTFYILIYISLIYKLFHSSLQVIIMING